jgi:stage II sporulation protein D
MRPILALALFLTIPAVPAFATGTTTPGALRIGLDHSFRHSTALLISCERPFSLADAQTHRALAHGAGRIIYKVTVSPKGIALARVDGLEDVPVADGSASLVAMPGQGGFVKIARMDSRPLGAKGIPWHRYRGFLTARREPDGTLRVINTVPLEPYLYGVLPAEIGTRVPMEAMKAQAVAARTYALKNRGKCIGDGFDLDDTTRCEGYEGVDGETAASNAAVDGTRGQVLTYRGRMIDAPYSTDSGGMTACDDSGDCPYLQAVRDGDMADGRDYAATGRYHTWTQTWTPTQLAQSLARDVRTRVARFVSLTVDGLDTSGRITTATVAGADGAMRTVTGPQLRQILGYDVLRSTRVMLTRTPTGDYRFDGKGWGHGLGMSQDGAVAMAGPPYRKTYLEILKHYYVGAQIALDTSVTSAKVARHGF